MVSEKNIIKSLEKVIDPELGVNIVDLGLIYGVDINEDEGEVVVRMTLTSPGCPLAPVIDQMVRQAVRSDDSVKEVRVELVWDPPWTPELMSEEVRAEFGMD